MLFKDLFKFCLKLFEVSIQRKRWHPTQVILPGKSHGRRSLVGCSPWDGYKSDTTERLHFHFWLSWIGEGNGNPLQCSCLENPRDGGAWWATIYGIAQSRTRLKRLSSSSSSSSRSEYHYYSCFVDEKSENDNNNITKIILIISHHYNKIIIIL